MIQGITTFLKSVLISLGVFSLAVAQVPPPPITSSGLNTQVGAPVVLPGGETQHNITGGTRPGGGANLFHSFGEFGVPDNHIANFLNDSAQSTSNILSRVTGGNPSNILGTIQTDGFGNANLFLMNPAGIVFGPNASLNVGGATHFTTADYLKLADGVQFTALPGAPDALLSIAPVAAFGFLESTVSYIAVEGSTLSVEEGQAISLVGGDILIGSGLNAPGGKIAIASVASSGEVLADTFGSAPNITGQSFDAMGTVSLGPGTALDVSGEAAGTVVIRGGQLFMTNAVISADTINQNGASLGIDIEVTGDVLIAGGARSLISRTTGFGNAGGIKVSSSGNMNIFGNFIGEFAFPLIDTHTSGFGNGGDVHLSSQGNMNIRGDGIALFFLADTGARGFVTGTGGDLNMSSAQGSVDVTNATLSTGNFIGLFTGEFGAGPSGNVNISANEEINFSFSNIITDSNDLVLQMGSTAGDVTLNAPEINFDFSQISTAALEQSGKIIIEGENSVKLFETKIEALTRTLPGGELRVSGENIGLKGSNIVSTTNGDGNAGNIALLATDSITLENVGTPGSDIPSTISSNTFSIDGTRIIGNSGNISLSAPRVTMSGGSQVNTSTGSGGNAGDIGVQTEELTLSGQTGVQTLDDFFMFGADFSSGLFTVSLGGSCFGPCGDSGNVNVTTESLVMGNGAQINSGTSSNGTGGTVAVNASNTIAISGTLDDGTPGGVFSQTTSTDPDAGAGGNIALTAGETFFLGNGATVSASSSGPANAGDIQLTADNTILLNGATVTTEAAQASGGNIKLTAEDLIQLNDSVISSSVQGDENTAGGDINVDPEFIILQDSQILARAVEGQGGNITLIASRAVLVDSFSVLDASSALGVSGSVNIEAPTKFLSGAIVPLEKQPVEVATLYGARCAAGAGGNFSTFVDSKTDSLSPAPGSFLASPLLPPSTQGHAMANSSSSPESPVVLTASIAPLVQGHAGEPATACP